MAFSPTRERKALSHEEHLSSSRFIFTYSMYCGVSFTLTRYNEGKSETIDFQKNRLRLPFSVHQLLWPSWLPFRQDGAHARIPSSG